MPRHGWGLALLLALALGMLFATLLAWAAGAGQLREDVHMYAFTPVAGLGATAVLLWGAAVLWRVEGGSVVQAVLDRCRACRMPWEEDFRFCLHCGEVPRAARQG